MKRQYRFDQTFIWDQSDLPDGMTLDYHSEEAHRQWLQIIEVLAKDNRRNSSFWYTQIASRNSSSLPFLYDLAMMLALERSSEFLTSYCFLLPPGARGRALAKCLRVRFPSIQFRIAKKTRIDGVISGLWQSNLPPLPTLRLWLGYWRAVVRPLLEARRHRRSSPPVPDEPVWILDTYVRLDSQGRPLADRYFNGILEALKPLHEGRIFRIYTPYGAEPARVRAALGDATGWIHKEDYLRWTDYLALFWFPIKSAAIRCASLDRGIRPLVRHYITCHRFDFVSVYGLLSHKLVRRLIEAGYRTRVFLDWFENQWMDRGLHRGFHQYSPQTFRIGYQPFQSESNQFNLFPSDQEVSCNLSPQAIAAPGRMLRFAQRFLSVPLAEIPVPAFRSSPDIGSESLRIDGRPPNGPALICLPLPLLESRKMLERVWPLLERQALIRPHPMHSEADLDQIMQDLATGTPLDRENFTTSVQKSAFVITAGSQTALEALALGRPVLVIGHRGQINLCPVPASYEGKMFRMVYSEDQIRETMKEFTAFWHAEGAPNIAGEMAGVVREECYPPVNEESNAAMIQRMKELIER